MQADFYGVHWEGPVAWLLQGRGASNFVGLKGQAPFTGPRGMCNHLIPTAAPVPDKLQWERFIEVYNDPLTQAMLPIPRAAGETIFFVEDPANELMLYLSALSRLSSPIQPVIKPAWNIKVRDLEAELSRTNIQPLVLVQASPKCQEILDVLGSLSLMYPRTVVVAGHPDMVVSPPIQRIQSGLDDYDLQQLITLPLENIGAALLRRYSRREQLDAPMETRQDRRERQLRERTQK